MIVPYNMQKMQSSLFFLFHLGFDFATTKAKITANYVEIVNLPIELIRRDLFAREVITSRQKEMIETIPLQSQRMEYLLDKIIIPTLTFNISTKFKSLLEVMEESGDEKLTAMAVKLGTYIKETILTINYIKYI